MTTHTTIGTLTNATDSNFREWVDRTITMLTAVGMVRTADTGQINSATILKPTTTSTSAGYAIFRLSGPPERPIFLRIDFGSGSNVTYPSMSVTICKGTDGAGGPIGVLQQGGPMGGQARSASPIEWRASGGPGYVALCPVAGPIGSHTFGAGTPYFLIERSPDGESVLIVASLAGTVGLVSNSTNTPSVTVVTYDTGSSTSGIPPVILPYLISGAPLTGGTPLAAASLGPVFPWVLFPPAQAPWQSRLAISYPGGDTPGSAFQVTLEGEDRTYLPIPLSDAYCAFGLSMGAAGAQVSRHVGLAIRWE